MNPFSDRLRRLLVPPVVALLVAACAVVAGQSGPQSTSEGQTVYVVRHMQKDVGEDPGLTAEGQANAVRLAAMLAGEGIASVHASRTRRAMATARPLAERLGLDITPYDPARPEELVEQVRRAGGGALVVGHSNTVPDLVERFGGLRPEPIADHHYGTLYIVRPSGEVELLTVR